MKLAQRPNLGQDHQFQIAGFPFMGGMGVPILQFFSKPPPIKIDAPLMGHPPPLKNEAPHWNVKHPFMKWFLAKAQ